MLFHTYRKRIKTFVPKNNNTNIEKVEELNFLGLTLDTHLNWKINSENIDLQPDINRRIGLATGVMRSLRQPLRRHSSISLETKLRVCRASVLSVLLYGSECWPISTSLCSRLSAFDMQAQRTITNTKWFEYKTNIEVRTLTNRQPIQRYIAQGRLRWSSTPVSTKSSCTRHLHLQPEGSGVVETTWSPSHAME